MQPEHDLQPLLDTRQNVLSLIFADNTSIDTKALALLGADLAILIFIGQASLTLRHWWIGTLLIGSYLLSMILGIVVIRPWGYNSSGVNLSEHPEYLKLDRTALLLQLISDTELAIEDNKRLNLRRWKLVLASFLLTTIGIVTLFAIM